MLNGCSDNGKRTAHIDRQSVFEQTAGTGAIRDHGRSGRFLRGSGELMGA